MKEKINQKGFIRTPLLIGIIVIVVVISGTGAGAVLHKQGKLAPLIANISQVFTGIEQPITTEIKETDQKELLEQPSMKPQIGQELDQAKIEAENIELERERLKAGQEAQKLTEERLKQEELSRLQEETRKKAEQDSLLGVENCKSEYASSKERMITQFTNYEFPYKELEVKKALEVSYQQCADECLNSIIESMGSHYPSSALSMCNYCKQTYLAMVDKTLESIKSSQYNAIEQQLQQEYRDCLNK